MKKFTTLEEDLIKKNAQLNEKFDNKIEKTQENLKRVNDVLIILKEEYTKQPYNLNIINEVEHINDELTTMYNNINKRLLELETRIDKLEGDTKKDKRWDRATIFGFK